MDSKPNASAAAPPKKKPVTTAMLRAVIEQLKTENATLAGSAAQLNQQVTGYRSAQTQHEQELRNVEELLVTAKLALRPFKVLKAWEGSWPPLEISPIKPITYGALKGAYDASVTLGL